MTSEERAIWDRLLAEQPIPDVRACPAGLAAWGRTYPERAGRMVVARDAERAVAIAPLTTTRMPWRRLLARRVEPLGDLHWRCGYPITGRDVTAGIAALLETLVASRDWDVLVLGPMLADAPAYAAIVALGTRLGMRPVARAAADAPRVVFDGTWDAYYAARSGNLRSMVSRGERRLRELGPLVLEEHRGGDSLDAALDAFYRIEASGWKGRESSAIAADPSRRALYDALARETAALGTLRVFLLRAGDRVVAGDFCIEHDGVVFMLKTGYDEELARCSPGQVLRKQVIARLWAAGDARGYDLMPGGGDHGDYKRRWASDVRAYGEVRLVHPRSLRARALMGLGRLARMR